MANYYTHASFVLEMPLDQARAMYLDYRVLGFLCDHPLLDEYDEKIFKAERKRVFAGAYPKILQEIREVLSGSLPEGWKPYAEDLVLAALQRWARLEYAEYQAPRLEIQRPDAEQVHVWISHDETFCVSSATWLVQAHLTRNGSDDAIVIETGWSCSRPLTDAYGGGVTVVTRYGVESDTTSHRGQDLVKKLAKDRDTASRGDAICPACGKTGGVRADVECVAYYYLPMNGKAYRTEDEPEVTTYDGRRYECDNCGEELDLDDIKKKNPNLEV